MGEYEEEEGYDEFVTWGAKKYAYRQSGKIGVTTAGVSRKYSGSELLELGGLEAFRPGLVFRRAGGLELKYNDTHADYYEVDGREIELTNNIYFREGTYTLGITSEYSELIGIDVEEMLDTCI